MLKKLLKTLSKEDCMIILSVLLLIISELFLNRNEAVGFALYFCIVGFFLIYLHDLESLNRKYQLIIALMIMPIVRLSEIFITLDFPGKVILSYCILLFLSLYYSLKFKLNYGYKKENLNWLPVSIILGILIGLIGNFLFELKYPGFIFFIPLIAFSEEILFRGVIQNLFKISYGTKLSILTSSLLYGIFSLGYGILFALFIFFAGMVLGIVYVRTRNIFLTVTINMIMHLFLFVLPYGFYI